MLLPSAGAAAADRVAAFSIAAARLFCRRTVLLAGALWVLKPAASDRAKALEAAGENAVVLRWTAGAEDDGVAAFALIGARMMPTDPVRIRGIQCRRLSTA